MTTTVNDRVLKPGSSLRDRLTFPTFGDCPDERELDHRYYTPPPPGSILAAFKRHWCLLGEILSVQMRSGKLEIFLRDTAMRTVRLESQSEEDGGRELLSHSGCKVGGTVVVLYALQHTFPQGYLGLAPETNKELAFIPHPLEALLSANDRLWGHHPTSCAASDCERSQDLLACSGCRLVRYCSEAHQRSDWRRHKALCKAAAALTIFTERDWTTFTGFYSLW